MADDKRQLINGASKLEKQPNGIEKYGHEETCWQSSQRCLQSAYGVALGLLSGLSFASCSIFIHLIGHDVAALQINFISVFAIGVLVVPVMLFKRVRIKLDSVKDVLLIIGKGVGYTVGMLGDVVALTLVSPGNVTAITNGLLPVFTAVFACIFIKEMLRPLDGVTIVLNVSGVLMITQPSFLFGDGSDAEYSDDDDDDRKDTLLGNIMAAISAVGFGAAYVVARGLGERVHVLTSLFYDAIIASVISVTVLYAIEEPDWDMEKHIMAKFVGVAVSTAFAQWASYRCLQLQSAAVSALLFNIEVVSAYFLEYFVVHGTPTSWEIAGAALVLFSSGLVAVVTWWLNLQQRKKEDAEGYQELQ
ncbi:solute carrier family 35 member G1-like [Glandiceps talaboti]